mgnify:CR=1 FL=1
MGKQVLSEIKHLFVKLVIWPLHWYPLSIPVVTYNYYRYGWWWYGDGLAWLEPGPFQWFFFFFLMVCRDPTGQTERKQSRKYPCRGEGKWDWLNPVPVPVSWAGLSRGRSPRRGTPAAGPGWRAGPGSSPAAGRWRRRPSPGRTLHPHRVIYLYYTIETHLITFL